MLVAYCDVFLQLVCDRAVEAVTRGTGLTYFTHPKNNKGRAYIPFAVVLLSVISHGVVLKLPLPQQPAPEIPPLTQPIEDISLVILSEQEDPLELVTEETLPTTQQELEPSQPENLATDPVPESESLVQTDVIPETALDEIVLDERISESPLENESEVPTAPEKPPEPTPVSPEEKIPVGFGDGFAHPGEVSDDCGLAECYELTRSGGLGGTAEQIIEGLRAKDYEVKEQDDLGDDRGRRVYEVSRPGEESSARYLIVFSDSRPNSPPGSMLYVMTDDKTLTLDDLINANV